MNKKYLLKNLALFILGLILTSFALAREYPEYSEDGTSTIMENRGGFYQRQDADGNSSWGLRHDNGYIQEFGPGDRNAFGVQSNNGFYQKWDNSGGYSYGIRK